MLVVVEYAALVAFFVATGRVEAIASPVIASAGPGISPLDEGAKLLLLGIAGGVATYATAWYERLLTSYERQARDHVELEGQLARAQLQSLKLQLHPHFLFNTLNTITALVTTDARAAERVITGLSELLRLSLHNAGEQEVPLERELDVLRRYLEIQQIRFSDRLRVEFRIESGVERALVPNLILQPLVENAIRHGLAPRAAGGCVEIRAERAGEAGKGEMLRLVVSDDGVGPRAEASARERSGGGVGLSNTWARLGHLYGDQHLFEAGAGERGGFVVRIEIPYRAAAANASPASPILEGVA
jgi:sensor histidine kinase YesM